MHELGPLHPSIILFPNSFHSWGQVAYLLKKRWNIAFNHFINSFSSSLAANKIQRKPLWSKEKEDDLSPLSGIIDSLQFILKNKERQALFFPIFFFFFIFFYAKHWKLLHCPQNETKHKFVVFCILLEPKRPSFRVILHCGCACEIDIWNFLFEK